MPSEDTIRRTVKYASGLRDIDIKVLQEGLELASLHHKAEQAIENSLSGWGLTARQMEILEVLYHHPDATLTPADLSDEVGLTRSAMTSALDSLEKLGHTVRGAHPSDRRMIVISLTPSGREFIRQHLPERYKRLCWLIGSTSSEERKVIAGAFTKVIEFFNAEKEGKRA